MPALEGQKQREEPQFRGCHCDPHEEEEAQNKVTKATGMNAYGVSHILKLEPMQFAHELNVRPKMKMELKGNTRNFHQIN